MPDDSGPRFDKATRDYNHGLRRMQRRRTISIANWTIIPLLVLASLILAAARLW